MLILILLLGLAGCGGGDVTSGEPAVEEAAAPSPAYRYSREYVFVADSDEPLVVPLAFRAVEIGDEIERGVRGWLARGATWDRFLDETERTPGTGGVWRVIPFSNLEIQAGGPTEVDVFDFQRAERKLRLEFDQPLTSWQEPTDTRFRLLTGSLTVGSETIDGCVLEILRIEPILDDGWPPGEDFDALFLTSGDSIQLVMAESIGGALETTGYAWSRTPAGENMWSEAEVRWLEVRPHPEARRDVPQRWSFRVPGAGIQGELSAQGYDAVLGPEREGRRAVEIRYTVTGWAEMDSVRIDVAGTIRHMQQ